MSWHWIHPTSWNRLEGALASFDCEVEYYVSRASKPDDPAWKITRCLLDDTRKALKAGKTQLGWKYFLAAQRIVLFGLPEDELQIKARSILNEADSKLDGWRKKDIVELLAQKSVPEPDCVVVKDDITAAEVFEASLILHEHYSNQALKLQFHRRLLGALAIIALLVVILWTVVLVWWRGFYGHDPKLIFSVILFGVLGASFSGILSLAKGVSKDRVPEQLANVWITLARQVAGIVSALAAYFLLNSGFINFGPEVSHNHTLILAVSFAAGFSERLVVRTVDAISK